MRIVFDQPIDLRVSLAPFGRFGDDLLDRVDAHRLVRTVQPTADRPLVAYTADLPAEPTDTLEVTSTTDSEEVAAAVRRTFVTPDAALAELCRRDAAVGALAGRYPGLAVVLVPDPLAASIRSISAQQINLRWASVIRQRLALRYGKRLEIGSDFVYVLDAEALAEADVEELRQLQFTYAKARAVVATARASTAGELRRDDLERLDDEQLVAHLTRLPGIGRWSAEWFLARTLGRPKVVAGDLAVRKAIGRLYAAGMPSEDETRRLTQHWGEAATLAQALALHDLAVSPSRTPAR